MATRIIIAEANTDAPKPLCGVPDGSGYRDMARSESSAQELGRPADGKPTAGVGRVRSSVEASNDRGAKGLHTKSVSNNEAVTRMPPIRKWLKVCVQEPNGVRVSPKGRGTPQGGVISPLLANIYLHWFETIVSLTAKTCGQVMSIVRYADDFVILERAWVDGFLQKVEGILEGRMELTVNREKTRRLDFREPHTSELNHYGMYWLKWADVRR